ncbi:MAG: response regulator [Anaerolineae bacterium]|nr:response regulator [Anaerolineae bacterium]
MAQANILVVEDEGIVALDIQNRLRRQGYTPIGRASSGMEALALVKEHRPDLVLMDIRIQGDMDGIETAQKIQETYDIPVVYLTAHTDEQTVQRAKVTDPYGYLIKPFEEHELQITIEIALYKHQMEQALRQQTRQLEQILHTVPEGVLLLDPDNHILSSNRMAKQHLRVLAGAGAEGPLRYLGSHTIEELAARSNLSTFWQEIAVEEDARSCIYEVSVRPILMAKAAKGALGKPGWVVVTRDVTEIREIQKRVHQQERLAGIGQLAAGIAHDFNNLIASITLAVEAVQMTQDGLSERNAKRLSLILEEGKRASQLIRQIMDFSRKSTVEKHPVNLVSVLEELRRILEHTLPEHISIEVEYDGCDYTLDGDAAQLTQALLNLSLNSRDAMPNGGTLRFEVQGVCLKTYDEKPLPEMDSGNWLQLTVTDTGTGIPEEIVPHVFEPFFTTKGPTKGTGLGLAQVYGIVKQHGGHVDIESQPGTGTKFTVYLPSSAAIPDKAEIVKDDVPVENNRGQDDTILLVEDNPSLRATMSELLCLLDYTIIEATNGREALELMTQHQSDVKLVITDLIMPGQEGMATIGELRGRWAELPILAISGGGRVSALDLLPVARSLGANATLPKPISAERLFEVVDRLAG